MKFCTQAVPCWYVTQLRPKNCKNNALIQKEILQKARITFYSIDFYSVVKFMATLFKILVSKKILTMRTFKIFLDHCVYMPMRESSYFTHTYGHG